MKTFPGLKDKIELNRDKEDESEEIRKLRAELTLDLDQAKRNRNYSYMRNHRFFKDGVLMPSRDTQSTEDIHECINSYGEKIFQQSQSQNKQIFNYVRALRLQSPIKKDGAKVERNLKQKIMDEINSHL